MKSTNVWLYARSARDEGGALENQMSKLRAFTEQNGYQVVGASQDIGSGRRADHPGLNEVRAAVTDGRIDAVLVTEIARISRNVGKFRVFHEMLSQHDVKLIKLDGAYEEPAI